MSKTSAIDEDEVIYSISVADILHVMEEEGFRLPTTVEIQKISDSLGDHIGWYDAILMTIQDVLPDLEPESSSTDDE